MSSRFRFLAAQGRGIDAAAMAAGIAAAFLLLDKDQAGWAAVWWIACVVVIRSDLQSFIIPDMASLAIALAGLGEAVVEAWVAGGLGISIAEALAAAAMRGSAGFAVFWLIARGYSAMAGREGLGFGDVKLAGASAIWLDFADQAAALEVAALAALALVLVSRKGVVERQTAIPFGAFLAPAAWLVFVAEPLLRDALALGP